MFDYIKLISLLGEINRPPGGKVAFKKMLESMCIYPGDKGLDVGCNTGFCTLEAVRIKKVTMIGLDISADMIHAANTIVSHEKDFIKTNISYVEGDAMQLPFEENSFDFVFSGGSTVFVPDIAKALKEYKRVVKDWGFVGELNFFYKDEFPKEIVDSINEKLGIDIKSWNLTWWLNKYKEAGFEVFEYNEFPTDTVSKEKIIAYVDTLIVNFNGTNEDRKYISDNKSRLIELYSLFNENNKYLNCGVFILRKRYSKEEPFLFAS